MTIFLQNFMTSLLVVLKLLRGGRFFTFKKASPIRVNPSLVRWSSPEYVQIMVKYGITREHIERIKTFKYLKYVKKLPPGRVKFS